MVYKPWMAAMGPEHYQEKWYAHLKLIDVSVNAIVIFAVEFIALLIAYRIFRRCTRGNGHCRNKNK
jgi:hypothetical protein